MWDHLTCGEDGPFLLYLLPRGVGGSPGDVSEETNSDGDKEGRSMAKSQLERQQKTEKPSLPGSWACWWRGEDPAPGNECPWGRQES